MQVEIWEVRWGRRGPGIFPLLNPSVLCTVPHYPTGLPLPVRLLRLLLPGSIHIIETKRIIQVGRSAPDYWTVTIFSFRDRVQSRCRVYIPRWRLKRPFLSSLRANWTRGAKSRNFGLCFTISFGRCWANSLSTWTKFLKYRRLTHALMVELAAEAAEPSALESTGILRIGGRFKCRSVQYQCIEYSLV